MRSVTLFVVADSPAAQNIRALVESWTRAGILEPSLWATPSTVDQALHGPPSVTATHVHRTGTSQVQLFEHVGRFRLDVVRVVVGHVILHDGEMDAALDSAAGVVAASLSAALPRRTDANTNRGTRLHRSVVMIPVSGVSGAALMATRPDWEVNVVISPEDRPDLDRANVYVRHPGNFEGHAANALAAVGGILRGVPTGVLDGLTSDSTTTDGDVVVARISIRAIVGDDMLDDVATRVLDTDELGASGPASMLPWARPATHPDEVARDAAAHMLRQPEWAPSDRPQVSSTRKANEGLAAALRAAVAFNFRTSGAVLSWWLSLGRARAEKGATEAIVGAKAGTLVTLGPRPVEDLARASERLLRRERSEVHEAVQASRMSAPPATTWSNLRTLAFALADGGDLGNFPEPRQAGKRELLPASSIVPHPDSVWSDPSLNANDPLPMQQHLRELDNAVREAKVEREVAETALRAAHTAREENPPNDESGDEYWPDDATLDSLAAESERAEIILAAAEEAREQYGLWHDDKARSTLWQIGADLARRITELRKMQAEIDERSAQDSPPAERLRRAQRGLRRWWAWTVPVWALLAGGYAYAYFGPLPEHLEQRLRPTTEQLIVAEVLFLAVATVLLVLANHRFYKAVRAYEWEVEGLVDRIRNDRALYLYAGQERARLQFLYETLRDWMQIIGEVLHRPWNAVDRQYSSLADSVIDALPASTGLAQQTDDDDTVSASILMQAISTAYPKGWASRQFETAYDAWEEEQPSGSRDGYRPPDVDTLVNRASPRRRLLEFWVDGSARSTNTLRVRRELRDAVQEGVLELPTRRVLRLGRFGDDESYSERDFFAAMATESTAFTLDLFTSTAQHNRQHYVERSIVWLPEAARALSSPEGVEAHRSNGAIAVRVDISKRMMARELEVFAWTDGVPPVDPSPEMPTVVTSSDDSIVWH